MTPLERLKFLRRYFRKVPAKVVNLERWECGTQACLAGHALEIPEFQAEGFTRQRDRDGSKLWPAYKDLFGFAALEAFFGTSVPFERRGEAPCDPEIPAARPRLSDKGLALARLDRAIMEAPTQ
jgi:hypothetical protein